MPIPLTALEKSTYLKMLLMGPPKVGRTTAVVTTAPAPMRILLCEDPSALQYARMALADLGMSESDITKNFDVEQVSSEKEMLSAIVQARADADSGKIKTLFITPLTFFADRLIDEAFILTRTREGNDDGRRAHPEMTKRLRKMMYQWLALPCHVIIESHYLDVGDAAKGGGEGKVPMLPNREARSLIAGMIPYVVWMDFRNGARKFVTTPQGAWGPGCRGLRGSEEIAPDVRLLMGALGLKDGSKPQAPKASQPQKTNGVQAKTALSPKPQVAAKR